MGKRLPVTAAQFCFDEALLPALYRYLDEKAAEYFQRHPRQPA